MLQGYDHDRASPPGPLSIKSGWRGGQGVRRRERRNRTMPPSVSSLSKKLVNEVRLQPEEARGYARPVYVDTEQITGYFRADALREVIAQREDLSYMLKTVLNEDREGIPGFTF